MARLMSTALVVAALAWAALAAYTAVMGWPRMPLDMPANDPAVRSAFDRAVMQHVIQYAVMGLVPLGAALALRALLRRRG